MVTIIVVSQTKKFLQHIFCTKMESSYMLVEAPPEFRQLSLKLRSSSFAAAIKKNKSSWGLFEVIGQQIKFERWYPSSGGPLPVFVRRGKIINDTTFIITETYKSDGTERNIVNESYHFRKFSNKPSNNNPFI